MRMRDGHFHQGRLNFSFSARAIADNERQRATRRASDVDRNDRSFFATAYRHAARRTGTDFSD